MQTGERCLHALLSALLVFAAATARFTCNLHPIEGL
jgi:hypothetical protein